MEQGGRFKEPGNFTDRLFSRVWLGFFVFDFVFLVWFSFLITTLIFICRSSLPGTTQESASSHTGAIREARIIDLTTQIVLMSNNCTYSLP